MTPFDLKSIDSAAVAGQAALVDTLVDQGKRFLSATGKESEGAAILLTRLLTRRDTVNTHLMPFLTWCIDEATKAQSNDVLISVFHLRGILYCLCTLYKFGPRPLLLPTLSKIVPLTATLSEGVLAKSNSLIKKLLVKLTQRLGLCYLKPKLAKWRYQRGNRSLAANLSKATASTNSGQDQTSAQGRVPEEAEEDEEIPEDIEEIVQVLLNGLRDKDTIVRWSAAKGVGRISARLPQELATEIVASVIDLFEEDTLPPVPAAVSDSTWHGACLLMPEWLEKVVPWISLSLHWSACSVMQETTVCWSFFRAYDPALLLPHIAKLSRRLIVSATLDREQRFKKEWVDWGVLGRLAHVPNGIEIVTIADYFSVGIADYAEYRLDIITHVSQVMICHWDKAVRILASQALYKLAFIDLNFVLKTANSYDLSIRHGVCLALGEICLAWSQIRNGSRGVNSTETKDLVSIWWTEEELELFIKPITQIIPTYPPNLLDTFGSDLTRISLCHMVACLSDANWPSTYRSDYILNNDHENLQFDSFISSWWSLVHSTLENRDEAVQEVAAQSMSSLTKYCWPHDIGGNNLLSADSPLIAKAKKSLLLKNLVSIIVAKSTFKAGTATSIIGPPTQQQRFTNARNSAGGSNMIDRFPRRGYALAAGLLPASARLGFGVELIQSLVALVKAVEGGGEDSEGRRNAVLSICSIFVGLGVDGICQVVSHELLDASLDALFIGMEDYSVDSRGDVGSWVPNERMVAVEKKQVYLRPEALLRQSVEKIDRVREAAGVALSQVLNLENVDLGIQEQSLEASRLAVKGSLTGDLNWLNTADVCLAINEFRNDLLVGLVVSVGGISESLVRFSTSSFIEFVNSLPMESSRSSDGGGVVGLQDGKPSLQILLRDFTALFSQPTYIKDRISVSLIEVTDVLVGCGAISKIASGDGGGGGGSEWIGVVNDLFDAVKKEVFKCKDVKKVLAAIKVFIGLAALAGDSAKAVRQKALTQLVVYLTHPYPRVRRASSEGLYIALTTGGEEQAEYEDNMEGIEDVLLTTDWDQPVAELKELRVQMAQYLGVKLPVVAAK
ncbi:tubulin folding cofactor D C terminal-domain-containing protein [Obelidium mucronatum]|nr:tubulin folding cofactor D C terminal-domain-containing protein [Obelidium mucronatum]